MSSNINIIDLSSKDENCYTISIPLTKDYPQLQISENKDIILGVDNFLLKGNVENPSLSFMSQKNTGIFLTENNYFGISVYGTQRYSISPNDHILYIGDYMHSSALRFTTFDNITYIQNSSIFNAKLSSPDVFSFQTIRIAPYLSTTSIIDIQRNNILLGSIGINNNVDLNLLNGVIKINNKQVICEQQSAITDITNEDDITVLKIKFNSILKILRTHGLIAS